MTRTHTLYIALGVLGGLAVGLALAGSLGTLAPLAILLVCPLMMLVMMRTMNHGATRHEPEPAHHPDAVIGPRA